MKQVAMRMLRSAVLPITTCVVTGLSLFVTQASAADHATHEEGVLKVATRSLPAGDSISLAGEKFGANSQLTLLLTGMSGTIELAKVRTDSAGAFTLKFVLPADAAHGAYRLIALATDGDEVAGLDVTVVASAASNAHDMDDMGAENGEPSDEPLVLDRARSGPVSGGAIAFVAVAVVLGVVLLRRPKAAS